MQRRAFYKMENRARLSALIFALAATPAAAQIVFVPCDYPLPVHASAAVHVASAHRWRAHKVRAKAHHRHLAFGVGGRRGLHLAATQGMCPVYLSSEELGGPAGFGAFGGGWVEETAGTDLGGIGGDFAGAGVGIGGGDLGSPQLAVYQTNQTTEVVEIIQEVIPPPFVPRPPPIPTPIPETSTWLMLSLGFAALALKSVKRVVPCFA